MSINLSGYRISLLAIVLCCFISCKKNDNNLEKTTIDFGGITSTDIQGVAITTDSTDWNIFDTWNNKENDLFSKHYQTDCQPVLNYKIDLFPNPNKRVFSLLLDMPDDARLDFRMVDRFYNLLVSKDSIESKYINFDFQNLVPKDTVRMYYRFVQSGCEFRGHGDIIFQ